MLGDGRGCGNIRTSGLGTMGSPQASPGDPGEKFPRVLRLSILYPNVLITGELQPVKLQVDSELFIHV